MPKKERRTRRPKSRSKKHQEKKILFKKTVTATSAQKKWAKRMFTILGGIIGLMGFISAIVSILPKISLSPGVALDSSNPLNIMFTISNDGPFKVKDITYETHVFDLSSEGKRIELHGNKGNIRFVHTEPKIPELDTGEKTTFQHTFPIKGNNLQFSKWEFEIVVFFRPAILPFIKKRKRFRYSAVKDDHNQWHWINRASSEKLKL